jgi:O-antigen/teichoic acid export membrane protein
MQRIRQLLSPSKPEILTDDSRGADRHHRALLTGIAGIGARAVSVGVSVVTVPLTLHYLGNERFGLWMTISAVLAMAGFADFGIGNGVLNTVSIAFGKDDLEGIRRAISSGSAVLTVIGAALLALFLFTYSFVSWGDLFHVTSTQARAEAGPAMAVFGICFALNIPLDIVQRVQLGLQQGFRTNIWQILSSAMALAGILAAIHLHLGLPALVAALAGAPVFGTAMNAFYFFVINRRDLLPKWRFVSSDVISQITSLGGMFFLLQLVVSISFSADNFIIARTLGAVSVTSYSIPQRMFSIITILITMLITPLWPAYGEAVSRGDMPWVRRTLSRTLLGVFVLTSFGSAVLILLSNRILLWWVGPQVHPSFLLLLGLGVWAVIQCVSGTLQTFLNGASIMRFQVVTHCIFGVSCVTAKLWFVHRYGVTGIPWATVITYSLLIIVPNALYVPQLISRITARSQSTPEADYSAMGY